MGIARIDSYSRRCTMCTRYTMCTPAHCAHSAHCAQQRAMNLAASVSQQSIPELSSNRRGSETVHILIVMFFVSRVGFSLIMFYSAFVSIFESIIYYIVVLELSIRT